MAWTNPKTWSVGETLTAANFNTYIRDNQNYLRTRHKLKTSDETVAASTTLQDDNDLILDVGASEVWLMDLYLLVDSNGTAGFKMGWSIGATGSTIRWAPLADEVGQNIWWSNSTMNGPTALKAVGDTLTLASLGAGNVWGANVKAIITVGGSAGNITLQWAQGTSSGSTILKAGSLFIATRVST